MEPVTLLGSVDDINCTLDIHCQRAAPDAPEYCTQIRFSVKNYGNPPYRNGPNREVEFDEVLAVFKQAGAYIPALAITEPEYDEVHDAYYITLDSSQFNGLFPKPGNSPDPDLAVEDLYRWLEECTNRDRDAAEERDSAYGSDDGVDELDDGTAYADAPAENACTNAYETSGMLSGPYLDAVATRELYPGGHIDPLRKVQSTVTGKFRTALDAWPPTASEDNTALSADLANAVLEKAAASRKGKTTDEHLDAAIFLAAFDALGKDAPLDQLPALLTRLKGGLDIGLRGEIFDALNQKSVGR